MKKVEHGKTFDRNAANPPAFEIFHNTVTEGYGIPQLKLSCRPEVNMRLLSEKTAII